MKKSLWLLPPLLAWIGFAVARLGHPSQGDVPTSHHAQNRRETSARTDVSRAIAEFQEEWSFLQRSQEDRIEELSNADLRAELLRLLQIRKGFTDDTDWETTESSSERIFALAAELGRRERSAALKWVEETAPDLRGAVMAGWAEADPDAAFQAVVTSTRNEPCDLGTLKELLQRRAEQGNDALKRACLEVPWELFRFRLSDPFSQGISLSDDDAVAPWIESGAARALAQEGVHIDNLFYLWGRHDPEAALEAWEDWPNRGESDFPMTSILAGGRSDPAQRERVQHALEALPPERLEKIITGMERLGGRNPAYAKTLLSLFPILENSHSAPETE